MRRTLPPSPCLEQLRNQARELLRACRSGDPESLSRAASQLSPSRESRSIEALSATLQLADALRVIAREHGFPSWPKLKQHVNAPAAEATGSTGTGPAPTPPAVPSTRAARQQFIETRAREIMELAARGELEAMLARMCIGLRTLLAVRERLLAMGGHRVLVDALLAGLEHPSPRVRYDAAHAMDHLADERCAEPLRRLLDDPVPRVRRIALHSLTCDRCKTAPLPECGDLMALVIEQALHDPSIQVRRHAAYALGGDRDDPGASYDPRAVAAIETLLARETDPALLRGARSALRRQRALAGGDGHARLDAAVGKAGDVEP
jgi:hypothetical protein